MSRVFCYICTTPSCQTRYEEDVIDDLLCGNCYGKLRRDYRAEAVGIDTSTLRQARS